MKIVSFRCENLAKGCVTDRTNPTFSYAIESEVNGAYIKKASISIGDECFDVMDQQAVRYTGKSLKPFT